ncbi:unnamed protein product, partial [Adineta ricciae]
TETVLKNTLSPVNLLMRVTPVVLPFPYQYTNDALSHKVVWVTDKGYITLDKPLYAIEPTENGLPNTAYIAPFWTNLLYVNETTSIKSVIHNGLSPGSNISAKVRDTVARQNQTDVADELAVYRVVEIGWDKLITSIFGSNTNTTSNSQDLVFNAYLINGPSSNFTFWNSYLRFDYNISKTVNSSNYQPIIIGACYRNENDTTHKSSVSFTSQILDFIKDGNDIRTYFLSSRLLSTCEQWYWKSYTDIIFQRAVNLTSVKRNPCPCSYSQASSDFRFYKLNSENRLERSNNIACFVPLNLFLPQSSGTPAYQQTCCYHTVEGSLVTSGEFAGSVLDQATLISLRPLIYQPQRIKERDYCCIARNGSIDWSQWCNLYYEIRPASTCDGYQPPEQAWFGGDPHIQTTGNAAYSCNMYGSFVYAQTTAIANATANSSVQTNPTILKDLVNDDLFSIVARTSKTTALLRGTEFFGETISYFSSFSLYLGWNNSIIIDVNIDSTATYQFKVNYLTGNDTTRRNPFNLSNDFVEYFYYPVSTTNSTNYFFAITKENQTISAATWNTYSTTGQNVSVQAQVPKLTITTWSGLALQCYLITNNMACTLLLPVKYTGNVEGLAFGNQIANEDQYCLNNSVTLNDTKLLELNRTKLTEWFSTSASTTYRNYINTVSCSSMSSSTYNFCVQDTLISQSSLLGQLTVKSSTDYTTANNVLSANPPRITLVDATSIDTPYTYLLSIPHNNTFQNTTLNYINVTVDLISSVQVQIRETNTSTPADCIYNGVWYSCPFSYTNTNKNLLQLTIIATNLDTNLMTYQKIQLVVNECIYGDPVRTNPTIISSAVQVLFCVCDTTATGDYCDKTVSCTDMTACRLNFNSNVSCAVNISAITMNTGQAPYQCMNNVTNVPCANTTDCCRQGYQFNADVQQCLFRPVCNETLCGLNNTCQNSELQSNGYICICNGSTIFDGTTCVQKKVCDNAANYPGGFIPCTGQFQVAVDSGTECICKCQSGYTNSSGVCTSISANVVCDNTTYICYNMSAPNDFFCQFRTQVYNISTNSCQSIFCSKYCQYGNCSGNEKSYSCQCPPGRTLNHALNCAVCDDGLAGPNCSLICDCEFGECNVNAAGEADKCTCANGYTGYRCDRYIDYCSPINDTCNTNRTNQICKLSPTNTDKSNLQAGYSCLCQSGYERVSNNSVCTDINECLQKSMQENICPASTTTCVNLEGSYRCDCRPGYIKTNNANTDACIDIDECATNSSTCAAYSNSYCVNLVPFYECRCNYGYAPNGDYNQIYTALKQNQTCQVYDQCAANRIDCGGGKCTNSTNSSAPLPGCYCDSPLQLVRISASKYDCICTADSYYYKAGVCAPRPDPDQGLSGESIFRITISCENESTILDDILKQFNATFGYSYNLTITNSSLGCDVTGHIDVTLDLRTSDNITIQNNAFEVLTNVTSNLNLNLYSVGKCKNITMPITNVTGCYLYNLCDLCGTNAGRGVCTTGSTGTGRCQCFVNTANPSASANDEFCYSTTTTEPTLSTSSPSSNWTPIIVGVLAGLAGLFCAVTCCLLAIAAWRRRRRHPYDPDELLVRRIWHLPRAQVPKEVTAENVHTYIQSQSSVSTSTSAQDNETYNSDRSTYRTNYDHDTNGTVTSAFFKQLDQDMGPRLRATMARPNTNAMLASLPTATASSTMASSFTASTSDTDDPIHELDDVIPDDDIAMTFHDPLDDLFQDNEMLEVINPNLKLPRPQVDSQPTGLFSFFTRH